jgi:nucleotide-binding universal stress UspA family protein
VRWAAREAARRQAPLRLVHVCTAVPPGHPDPTVLSPDYLDELLAQGRRWLSEAADLARATSAEVEIGTEVLDGIATQVLIEESSTARLVVLGLRGLGGFSGLLVGSVAVGLAAHGHCPVVVVKPSDEDSPVPQTGPVVVGVDGSPLSDDAVAFAFDAAASRGVALIAVHTWLDVNLAGAWTALPWAVEWATVQAEEERLLTDRLAPWREKYPDLEVRRVVTKDRPLHALLDNAAGAQLIVVGSRGRGGFTGLALGSVSQALLRHAEVPVAVARRKSLPH